MTDERKYIFSWDKTVGVSVSEARPSLGPNLRLEAYRLFQFTLRDVLEEMFGTELADVVFRRAGALAGEHFYNHYCIESANLNELAKNAAAAFVELGMGILRVEDVDSENGTFIFTVNEDLDCSGMEDTDEVICVYDEGLLQGVLKAFTGKDFEVREVDCWCTGGRVCRFEAKDMTPQ